MLFLCLLTMNSCILSQKVTYVKDMAPDTLYSVAETPPLRVQKNDRLSIEISARNPELAVPFNGGIGSYTMNESGTVSAAGRSYDMRGYLVDQQGNISFPVLGSLAVEGLSLQEVKDLLYRRLKDENYIDEPIVRVELLNLKIQMMGEVNSVGILEVPDSRITLLEAITRSGGLTTNATTDIVTVIRQEGGKRYSIEADIESVDLFDSPAFYLQQNDIVYVKPKAAEQTVREERSWRYFSTILGSVTLIFSVINLVK